MGTVNISLPSDGSAASVSQYNTPITSIVTALNGNLDSNNISSVSGTKVTAGTLPGTAFDAATAGGWMADTNTYTYSANNGGKEFVLGAGSDPTSYLSPGMKMKLTRGIVPPTQCMAFASGSSQYATKASPTGITFTSAFTCEAWIYVNSYTGSTAYIIDREDGTQGWGFFISANGQIGLYYGASGGFTTFTSYQAAPLKTWVHVAGVISSVSGKTGAIYINGTLVPSSTTGAATTLVQPTADLRIGAYSHTVSGFFDGYISEARVWSVAQSAANIQANMAINLTGSESNLVGLWKGGGNFNDATSNANNLTAQASAIATQAANPFNATEYAIVRAVSSSTVTLYAGDAGTIPNQTLNTPQYSVSARPFGWPAAYISDKVWGTIIWCANVTTTATATGTQLNGATMTVTVPTGGKRFVLRASSSAFNTGTTAPAVLELYSGSVEVGRVLGTTARTSTYIKTAPFVAPAGSVIFSMDMWSVSGTVTFEGGTSFPALFTLEEA